MSDITSYEILEKEIENAGGRPKILEALWDGDTQGWFLVLNLYLETGRYFWKREKFKKLGTVSFGGDIRLFTGDVPAWPEAECTKEWGKKAAEKYGLTLYFPSPDHPDDDCPRWNQRGWAIKCADCSKLIIPTDSPHLPKDICHNCHWVRKTNEKIKNAVPEDGGVTMYLSKDDNLNQIGYCTHFKDFTIAPFINDLVQSRMTENIINIIILDKTDILDLKEKIENTLVTKLAEYKKPIIEERMKRFVSLYTMEYKGASYELMDRHNAEHTEISNLIYSFNKAEKAIAEDYTYKIAFKNGITYRDDNILRFMNYIGKGSSEIAEIVKHYAGILTEEEVRNTIKKLEQIDCVNIHENKASITWIGKSIV